MELNDALKTEKSGDHPGKMQHSWRPILGHVGFNVFHLLQTA